MRDIDKKMNSGKANFKELEDLGKEKEMFAGQKSGLEDQTLALMDEVEAAANEIETIQQRLDKARKQWDEHLANSDVSKKAAEAKLAELLVKRDEMAKEIEGTLMSRYEGLRKRKNGLAIAKMEGNACGACGAGLPESVKRHVKERQLELCTNCERILFAD
jgi:predicted  nucleic acid-binding Zn-ribbon protein